MSEYFGDTYVACRDRFRALASERGATLAEYPLTARGPKGETLTMDMAYLGTRDAQRVLTLLSGTHGVEGFAGSACQQQFLAEDFARASLPDDGAVLLIHAVNPFGFSWLRRTNEHNVDINRNCIDHTQPAVRRPAYVAFDPTLNSPEHTEESEAAFISAAMEIVQHHGEAYLQALITEGQYECPKGLYYGGNQEEESTRYLRRICREWIAGAGEALMIDFHTGLGDWGGYTIISDHPEDSDAHQFLLAHFPHERVDCPLAGTSVSAALTGEIGPAMAEELPGVRIRSGACEFGTYEGIRVLQGLRGENWVQHYGDRHDGTGRGLVAELLEVFRPHSADWRARVLAGGRECIADAWRAVFGS